MEYLNAYGCYEPRDLFEMMERGMQAKFKVMELFQQYINNRVNRIIFAFVVSKERTLL